MKWERLRRRHWRRWSRGADDGRCGSAACSDCAAFAGRRKRRRRRRRRSYKKEKEENMMSGLTEQLQEKDKIIWMQQRKILELSEKHNAEVKELKELQEQLMEMKEKNELSDVVIMKEKSRTQHDEVVSGQRGHAGDVGVVACHVYSVSFRLREKNQEKFSTSIGDDSVVMLGPNPSLKELSVKVESLASAAREANSGDGGGDGCEGTKLETSRRLEKNGIGTNGSGGGSIGGICGEGEWKQLCGRR